MPTISKVDQFVEDLGKGVHNFTSDATCTVTVVLCTNANAPVAGNSVLANLTTIDHSNLSSRVVTGITFEQSSGTAILTATDLVLTASGTVPTFRWVAFYNDDPTSPADPLIGFYDHGVDVNMQSGDTFTIDFGANGILTAS